MHRLAKAGVHGLVHTGAPLGSFRVGIRGSTSTIFSNMSSFSRGQGACGPNVPNVPPRDAKRWETERHYALERDARVGQHFLERLAHLRMDPDMAVSWADIKRAEEHVSCVASGPFPEMDELTVWVRDLEEMQPQEREKELERLIGPERMPASRVLFQALMRAAQDAGWAPSSSMQLAETGENPPLVAHHSSRNHELKDGSKVVIRMASKADLAPVARFLARMSEQSTRTRFPHLPYAERNDPNFVYVLVEFRRSLLACDPHAVDEAGKPVLHVVGLADLNFSSEPPACELSFAVADDYQGKGMGPILLRDALQALREMEWEGEVFAMVDEKNTSMLKVFERLACTPLDKSETPGLRPGIVVVPIDPQAILGDAAADPGHGSGSYRG